MRKAEFDQPRGTPVVEAGPKKAVRRKAKKNTEGKEPNKRKRKFGVGGLPLSSPTKEDAPEMSVETIMTALRTLPALGLQEPEVITNHFVCPVIGQPVSNGEPFIQGCWGRVECNIEYKMLKYRPKGKVEEIRIIPRQW